jgi:phosphoribosylformylglycinamidine synthase
MDPSATGGSVYLETAGLAGNRPPRVNLLQLRGVLDAIHAAISSESLTACHDVSQGGLWTAVAEMTFGGTLGAEIDLALLDGRADLALFNETAGLFVAELAQGASAADVFGSVPHAVIGRTTAVHTLVVRLGSSILCRADLDALEASWRRPMSEVFH